MAFELVGPRFKDPKEEGAYRERFLEEDGRIVATIVALMALATLITGFNDSQFAVSPLMGWGLFLGRLCGVACAGLLAVASLRTRRAAVMDRLVFVYVISGAAFSFLVQSTRPADYVLPIVTESAFTMMIWALLPNRFELQAVAAGVVVAEGAGWLLLYRRPLAMHELLVIFVTLLAANGVGAFASWRAHRLRRTLYAEHQRLVASEAEVQRLSRLIPICMFCKKIRDEQGHWEPLEDYVASHTHSKFSHGMCDACDAVHGHGD